MGSTVNGKHLNVELDFNANTSKAKKEIQELQRQLNNVLNNAAKSTGEFSLNGELHEASKAAIELKRHLSNALNVDTGKFDISNFSKSLKESGKTLEHYRDQMNKLNGGREAFNSIAKSIMNAEVPLKRTNKLLTEFGITLKNTARWQISSSILHGFMGSIQSAFHYAEDLNRSLNNIRIVTGQNTDQMATFAKQANEAAKALSTTTTKYTDAALIYYQQGLSDKEVKERTDVTIKMANVARESAEEVSNQMTAVWNNFNKDGSEAVESFADKMTALGAATASSTSEIAEGLSKFAGIADTIGLSFDYATSALATVTATSRESADVVGTAFKTIFARMEGLKQGKTDEDGTDLNKYSQGLAKIGVQIKDQNGELKNMDTILDDMGEKWQGLSRDQKIATAQTVAGVRQYNQLMTLMDNWDYFQKNLSTAQGSEGTLQKQADIYAESWEAARDRVTAATEEIYSKLLNDDFFIDLNNGFAGLLDIVSNTIDALGGLQGVLSGIGLLVTHLYKDQMANAVTNFFDTQKKRRDEWAQSQEAAVDALLKNSVGKPEQEAYVAVQESTNALLSKSKDLTAEQEKQARLELEQIQNRAKAVEEYAEELEIAKKLRDTRDKAHKEADEKSNAAGDERRNKKKEIIFSSAKASRDSVKNALDDFDKMALSQDRFTKATAKASIEYEKLVKIVGNKTKADEYVEKRVQEAKAMEDEANAAKNLAVAEQDVTEKEVILSESINDAQSSAEQFKEDLNNIQKPAAEIGDVVVGLGQGIMSLSLAWSSLSGLGDIWTDDDVSTGEKLLSTITSMSMAAPMLMSGFKGLKEAITGFKPAIMSLSASIATQKAEAAETVVVNGALAASEEAAATSTGVLAASEEAAEVATGGLALTEEGLVAVEGAATASSTGFAAALGTVATELLAVLWPIGAVVAAAALLGVAFSEIYKETHKAEIAAKEAAETAKALGKQYEDLKQRAEDLAAAFDKYHTVIDTLESCKRGSEEWKEALEDVNDIIGEILQKYPDLINKQGLIQNTSNGARLNESIMEETINESKNAVGNGQVGMLTANMVSNKRNIDVDRVNLAKDVEGFWGDKNYKEELEVVDKAVEAISKNSTLLEQGADALAKEADISKEDAEELIEHKDTLESLIQATKDAEIATNNSNQLIAQQALGEDSDKATLALGGGMYDEYFEDLKKEWKTAATTDITRFDEATDENVKKVWDAYEKAMGQHFEMADNAVQGGDSDRTFVYKGENDEEVSVTADEVATTIAAAEALEKLENSADEVAKVLGDVTQKAGNAKEGILSWIGDKTFGSASSSEMEALKANKENAGSTEAYLESIFGGKEELEKRAKELGYTQVEDMVKAFDESVKDYDDRLSKVTNNLSKTGKEIFNNLDLSNVSLDAKEQISKSLEESLDANGIEGLTKFGDTLKTLTSDEIEKVGQALEGLDPEDQDFAEKFSASLKNLGVNIPDDKINDLTSALQSLSTVADASAEASLKQVQIAKSLSNENDTISTDDYNLLSESQKQYFQYTADGTYKLITDAKEFYDLVQNQSLDALNAKIQELSGKAGEIQTAIGTYSYDSMTHEAGDGAVGMDVSKSQMAYLSATGYDQEQLDTWQTAIDAGAGKASGAFKGLAEAIQETGDKTDSLKADLQATEDELIKTSQQAEDLMNTLDEDVDKEQWKELSSYIQSAGSSIKGLSNDVKKNKKECDTLSQAILRYDSSLEKVQGNMKEWKKLLKGSNTQDQIKAVKQLRNVYSDLLDVDPESLSESFLSNAENLKLLEQAAKGSEKAYNKLKEAAAEDIEAKYHLTMDDKDFWTAKEAVQTEIDKLNFEDIKVGAELNDEKLRAGLEGMVNAAHMSAEDAASYLRNAFSIDAEVKQAEQKQNVTKYYTDLTPVVTYKPFDNVKIADDDTIEQTTSMAPELSYQPMQKSYTEPVVGAGVGLQVTNLHKSAGGNIKFKNSSHGSGSAGRAARSPSGGGGGRGNRGGSLGTKTKKMKKDRSKPKKRDPYWDENLAIKRTEHDINKTEQESGYKYGEEKVKLLNKQNELLKKQLKNLKALGKEQIKQEKALRKKAKKAVKKTKDGKLKGGSGLGLKVKYDKDGYIDNYKDVVKQAKDRYKKRQKEYNKFVDSYNKKVEKYNKKLKQKGLSAEEQTKLKKKLKQLKKHYEKMRKIKENSWKAEKDLYDKRMKWIDEYTETEEEKQQREEEERERKREIIENNIEKWDVEIQLKIDTRAAKRDWDKFIKKMEKAVKTTTSHFHISEAADKVTGNRDTLKDLTQDYKDKSEQMKTYDWISKNWDQYTKLVPESKRIASSASEAAEKANEYKKELEDIGENAMAELQEGWNTYLESIDEGIEAIDAMNDRLKTQGEILDYGKQMIELIYGDKAYTQMEKYYETQDKLLTTQKSNLEKQKDMYERMFDKELAKAQAQDPTVKKEDYTTWTEAMKKYYDAAQNAASQLRDTNLAYVQNQIDAYNNLVDKQMDSLERSLTGGNLLDEEIAKWERQKKEMDLYLDETERTYEIQTLLNKYDKSIDETKNLETAKKLKKVRDAELKQLADKKKLTKFDLETANARYNVELKKIALEEAQKNKNTMKLSRNADGNWSYQYVANQDNVRDKSQELLDAENEWYEKSKDNQRRTKDAILSTWQEVIPQIKEILKDQSLSVEERIKKAEELSAWASSMSEGLADESCVAVQNMLASTAALMTTAYETDSQSFEQYNKDKIGFIDTFKQEGISDFYDLFDSFGFYAEGGAKRLVDALATGKTAALPKIVTESYKALSTGKVSVLGAFNNAGDNIVRKFATDKLSVENTLTDVFDNVRDAGETCWDNISSYIPDVLQSFEDVWKELDTINTEMDTVTQGVEDDLDAIRDKIYDELIPAWEAYWEAVNQSKEDTEQEEGEEPPEIPEQVRQNIDMSENKDVQKLMNPNYKYKAKKGGTKENKNAAWTYGIVDVVGDYAIEKTKDGKKYKVIDMVTGKTKKTCKSLDKARDKAYSLWNKTLDKLQKDPLVQEAAQYGVDVIGQRMHAGAEHVGNKGITDIYEKKKKNGGMISAIFSDSIHFDTGGYTGDWGNDGKIAVLHQKELVLNQEDTNNILDAVNGIRDISSLNGSISNAITDSISGIFADSIKNAVGQTIGINAQKQNETYTIENITAEFPNAQNVDDIREAILSLPRLASQYVARNLK